MEITGPAYACGRMLGKLQSLALRRRIERTCEVQQKAGIEESVLQSRVDEFSEVLTRVAPHWLDEARGLGEGAGVDPRDILMLNCLPPGFHDPPSANCTSFLRIGQKENWLFKIRDERNWTQSLHTQHVDSFPRMQIGRDIGNLGAGHVICANGLAGANDTGSHTLLVSGRAVLNDCHMLRYLAESANCVEEIPGCLDRLIDAGAASGAGFNRGAIFLFVDQRRGLILETAETDYVATFIDGGVYVVSNHYLTPSAQAWQSKPADRNTLRRYERMSELLARTSDNPSIEQVFALSRDRKYHPHALCNDDRVHFWMTISAQLHRIDRDDVEKSVNYACCGNTRQSLYVPLPINMPSSFVPFADGTFYRAANALYERRGCRPCLGGRQKAFERDALTMTTEEACQAALSLIQGDV